MKELHGHAAVDVASPLETCFALLEAVDRYPLWYPEVVREAAVVDRSDGGAPATVRTRLHVSHGPLVRDFDLLLAVEVERPASLKLTRIPHGPSDQEAFVFSWLLERSADATRIDLDLDANLSVPRLVPLGGIGDAIAGGFARAAANALNGR